MSATELLAVTLTLTIGLVLFVSEAPVRKPWARLSAVLLVEGLILSYFVWRINATLPALDLTVGSLWPWTFFLFEALAIVHEAWTLGVLSQVSDHSADADAYERQLRRTDDLPTVDVFVPSYSEGPAILEATIRGALGLRYPLARLQIWILDDGNRPWLAELCRKFEVRYVARPTHEHGKAGNLNYAFPQSQAEYLLVIDADFVLESNFLLRTLGFLINRPEVALVQTPQHFRNPDPVQHNLGGERAWTEEQHFFMTLGESARDSFGNAFCVGSGWVVRRSELVEMGGFPQSSICEDLEISYALLSRGKRTLHLNEALAYGLAPESVPEYLKQRVRWCTGTLQHVFLATGPLRARNLSLLDRLFYLEPIVYWFTFPFLVLMLLAPVLYWFTGIAAIRYEGDDIVPLLLCRFVASYLLIYWLSERKVMPPVTAIQKTLACFHISATLLKSVLSPFSKPFNVTVKGLARDRTVVQWGILWPFAAIASTLFLGMFLNFTGQYQVVEMTRVNAIDVGWSCWTLILATLCALACVERPQGPDYFDRDGEVRQASVLLTVSAFFRRLFV
jgi:cellulose synthase (UDP-forming)